mgnify:CR=1 FL=1
MSGVLRAALVGVAAALKTQSKIVGFVGGTHGDLIKKFEAGYTAGVHAVDPKIKVLVTYLTEDPNDGGTGPLVEAACLAW